MGFRFRKSIKAGPVRVNLSKSGIGYSVGGKGYRYTKKAGGGTRTTASIPGTGLSYTKDTGSGKKRSFTTSSTPSKTDFSTPRQTSKSKAPWQNTAGLILLIVGFLFFSSNSLISLAAFIASIVFLSIGIKKSKKTGDSSQTKPPAQPVQNTNSDYTESSTSQIVSDSDTISYTAKTYKVTGIQYHLDSILELASENPDYNLSKKEIIDEFLTDQRIWKYEFHPFKTELIPEPENPYDPKAIKVVVDGSHVGYIKSGSCAHLLKVINEGRIRGIDCEIGGGPYKSVYEDYDTEKERDVYTMERDSISFFVHLTVYESNI